MAQLIKLQDYVSRYEQDIFRYPGRFIRLKKERWQKTKLAWESGLQENSPDFNQMVDETSPRKRFYVFGKWLSKRNRNDKEAERFPYTPLGQETEITEDELKQQFLDDLFRFQIRWASSTLTQKSFVDKEWFQDPLLSFFVKRFPDHYLLMYKPIFLLKKAPVELDVILISPISVYCITILDGKHSEVRFTGSQARYWTADDGTKQQKYLNPFISLKRTSNIVKQILSHYEIDLPIKKVVLSLNDIIDYQDPLLDVELVDRRTVEDWHNRMKRLSSPLKHAQLTAAKHLLAFCQQTGFKRHEWDLEEEE